MSDQEISAASLGGLVPVKYIGKKIQKADNVAGTGLSWSAGEIHLLKPGAAGQLLKHADIWMEVGVDELNAHPELIGRIDTGAEPSIVKKPDEDYVVTLPSNLAQMKKSELQAYALGTFNETLPETMKNSEMVDRIVMLHKSQV